MLSLQEARDLAREGSDYRHIVSVSGGKDSAALALYLLQEYPDLPVEYVFCDTGCELPETYEYLDRLEVVLGKPIVRLNALDLLGVARKPGRNPFDVWLKEVYGNFLPSPRARWCTRVLKIQPFEKYVGEDKAISYIGIRGDEDREGYTSRKPPVISEQPNIMAVYPFKDDKIGLADVQRILAESGLGFPEYYKWRSRSGCYFCFYQQVGEWQGLKEEHPDLFEAAKGYEREENGRQFTWVDGRTLEELEAMPRREPLPMIDAAEGCAICHL
jgi:3'-phosphoadenosine 5'-phosphosulfate sulfotransferase (PAPS reductase)/FAD synthetase